MVIFFRAKKTQIEPIPYNCDSCGASATAKNEIPRCLGCGKKLCEICTHYFLCSDDYNVLSKKHKRKVKKDAIKLENIVTMQFLLIPMLIIPMFFVMIIFLVQESIVTILLSVMGGFCAIFGIIFFFAMKKMVVVEEERIKGSIRGILFSYDIKKYDHAKSSYNKKDEEIETVLCSYCGSESKGINVKYCEACGKELFST